MCEKVEYKPRYSDTDEPDDIGRWARIVFYKGLQIGWISKTKNNDRFLIAGTFPTDGNDGSKYGDVAYSLEEAKAKFEKAFGIFIDKITA